MTKYKKLNFKIIHQGGVILNHGVILAKGKNVIAAQIDLETKYPEIDAYSADENQVSELYLSVGKNTLHFNEKLKNELTGISFPDYPRYFCICADISRYTLSVCLVKY